MNKEAFLSIVEGCYDEFELLNASPDFYDYEKSFVALMQKMNSSLIEKQRTVKGARNTLPLRVISMNRLWAKVTDCIKKPILAKCA